ncbi:MAG: glycosyltransferase, partial [Rickettsiales bacterium]|nr:glycosyltransferase [Rickettsiales bacterium]
MHILHALFSPSLGGIEQAFLDITQALTAQGHHVTAMLRPDAPFRAEVEPHASVITVKPKGYYDIRSIWRVRQALGKVKPDVIIAHAPRTVCVLSAARWGMTVPLCGVAHGYKLPRMMRADHLVALTPHMAQAMQDAGYKGRVSVIPNMLSWPHRHPHHVRRHVPVIGAMGRLTPEKGFTELMQALQLLAVRGVAFEAHIAGEGRERGMLEVMAREMGLAQQVR